jgi:lipoprotein NlpD
VRITRAIGLIGLSCIVGYGCASSATTESATYVVRPQDTLYSIAWRHDLDFKDLARWNNIGRDYRIEVGQVLQLQPGGRSFATHPATSAPAAASSAHAVPNPVHPAQNSAAQAPRAAGMQPRAGVPAAPAGSALPASSAMQWVWPTDRSAAPTPVPGGGILVLGQLGQSVRAACSGRVVYTGSGIRGYGNLIIIKHGDNLLSAYAHTSELLVREGEDVAGGQTIAHMGTGPHQIAALYFEIRLNGKPVDPMLYLDAVK